jgi:predicted lipoprotein with Yx(FWY)xxD motif
MTQLRTTSTSARILLTACAAAALTLLAACGGSASTSGAAAPAAPAGTVLHTATAPAGSTVLVDAHGKTLYAADQETAGAVKCTGACLHFWHPLTTTMRTPSAAGLPAARLGTLHRTDISATQVTFDGKPLYTFALDTAAGTTKGDGADDAFAGTMFHWRAVTVDGSSASTSTGGSGGSGGSSGGGYGY